MLLAWSNHSIRTNTYSDPKYIGKAVNTLKKVEKREERKKSKRTERNVQNKEPTTEIPMTATADFSAHASNPSQRISSSDVPSSQHDAVPEEVQQPRKLPSEHGAPQADPLQSDDYLPQNSDGEIDTQQMVSEIDLDKIGSQVHNTLLRRQAEGNKENIETSFDQVGHTSSPPKKRSIFDAQPNAQRISFEDGEGDDAISDVSSDEGFQTQVLGRSSNANGSRHVSSKSPLKRHVREPVRSQGPSPKKARTQPPNSSRRSIHPPTRQNDEPSPSPMLDELRNANSKAKEVRAVRQKAPQVRKAWEADEIETFVALIEEHGTSWSKVKNIDEYHGENVLYRRDQVALKDKARNIKVDLLL